MSDYFITQITASDKRGNRLVDELLTSEGIRRDGNLDYTCGMYDDEMNLIATGSCFGNTLRCMAVSHEHQGEGLMNSIVSHLIELQFSRGNTHLFLYTKCDSARFFGDLGFYEIARINGMAFNHSLFIFLEITWKSRIADDVRTAVMITDICKMGSPFHDQFFTHRKRN
jgi:[citrate (pro-3S)-lyase] ligase